MRVPDWKRDEIVLAVDLVWQHGWKQIEDTDPRVVALSELLQSPLFHPLDGRSDTFRNPNGVARKTADIATSHPAAVGRRTNGNRLDREVLLEFLDRPDELHAEAEAIRAAVRNGGDVTRAVADPDLGGAAADEGDLLVRRHLRRERDTPLSVSGPTKTRLADLALVCSNCHRMIHRRPREWLTVEELAALVRGRT